MDYIFEEVRIKRSNAPRFVLNGEEVDIWDKELIDYHSKSVSEYVREKLLEFEKRGLDPFEEIIGKEKEKEMVKTALMSGSNILFKGEKGLRENNLLKGNFKAFTRQNPRHQGVQNSRRPDAADVLLLQEKALGRG